MSDQGYHYEPIADTKYCYPGTSVLVNRFNITDQEVLTETENNISLLNIGYLESHPVNGDFDLDHLKKIHHVIFADIYHWAGEIREGDFLAKGSSVFCRGLYIESYAKEIHKKLVDENFLQGLDRGNIEKRMAYYMGEINALHPFREGNGRTQREFFRELALNAGYVLNFSRTTTKKLLQADMLAFNGSYEALEKLIDWCLITENEG